MSTTAKAVRKIFKLNNVRLSYPHLFTPRVQSNDAGDDKKPEYSASLILDKKEHAKIIREIEAEAVALAKAKWGKVPGKFKLPTRDGETFKDDETGEFKDGYGPGKVGINVKALAKPQCVRRDPSQAATEEDLYGGCYVNTAITLFTWHNKASGYGVSASLGPFQFYKNGERFGGAVIAAGEVFEDLGEDDDGEDVTPPAKAKGKKAAADDDDDFDPTAD